jgi:hypothetical protein
MPFGESHRRLDCYPSRRLPARGTCFALNVAGVRTSMGLQPGICGAPIAPHGRQENVAQRALAPSASGPGAFLLLCRFGRPRFVRPGAPPVFLQDYDCMRVPAASRARVWCQRVYVAAGIYVANKKPQVSPARNHGRHNLSYRFRGDVVSRDAERRRAWQSGKACQTGARGEVCSNRVMPFGPAVWGGYFFGDRCQTLSALTGEPTRRVKNGSTTRFYSFASVTSILPRGSNPLRRFADH